MISEIRILTLHQPWASAMGIKLIETRPSTISWRNYRGLVAFHAACKVNHAKSPLQTMHMLQDKDGLPTELVSFALNAHSLPTGSIVSVGEMVSSTLMTEEWIAQQTRLERCLGNYEPKRLGIGFKDIVKLHEPIPYKNGQGLQRCKDETLAEKLIAVWEDKVLPF